MELTKHFTLEELTFSETAIRKGLDNTPNQDVIDSLKLVCDNVLEPLRIIANSPIKITSGYRSKPVNLLVGGSISSQHLKGEAVDCIATRLTVKDFYELIKKAVKNELIEIDQCILEYNSWIHISYTNKRKNRNQFLIIN